MAIRAVVFDCFGVLYAGTLTVLSDLCQSDEHKKALRDVGRALDHGFLSFEAFAQEVAPLVHLSPEEVRRIAAEPTTRHRGVFAYATELKRRGYKVAVLSNFGRDSIDKLFTQDERETLFDTIIASGDIGVTKPHVSAYEAVVSRLHLKTDEVVMIDDWLGNIEGAKAAGLKGVVFTSLLDCKRHVEELLDA